MSKNLIIATALAVVAVSGGQTQAATYIKTQDGYVWPKHECTSTPCVDCTFLTYEACYAKAKQVGLTDERPIGFGPDQRIPLRIDPLRNDPRNPRHPLALQDELPLERECDRSTGKNNTTSHYLAYGKGQIVCPVPGATLGDKEDEPKPSASVAPRLPVESSANDAAVGIFFAQNCPGYITPAARQLMHTMLQMRAREAWGPYHEIRDGIVEAARVNRTSVQKVLFDWCIAAEPRIASIQDRISQAFK